MDIQPIGNNWFSLYPDGGSLEYNTGDTPQAEYHDDRKPLASVFRHIDGDKIIVKISGMKDKAFFYKDSDHRRALTLAKDYVVEHFNKQNAQRDIFSS